MAFNGKIIVNHTLERILKGDIFEVLFHHFPAESDENHESGSEAETGVWYLQNTGYGC
jgi:hypothetical protein